LALNKAEDSKPDNFSSEPKPNNFFNLLALLGPNLLGF